MYVSMCVQSLSDDVANCATSISRTQQLVQSKIQQQDNNDDSLTESTHFIHTDMTCSDSIEYDVN